MKIRSGFVSNSSSSSFIIKYDCYSSTFELAKAMVLDRGWDEDAELVEKIEYGQAKWGDCKDHPTQMPIAFHTCNYDTYINYKDGKYLVNTCNNHVFTCIDKYNNDVEWLGDYDNDMTGVVFYFPEYDLLAKKSDVYKYCDKHYDNYLCPLIGDGEFGDPCCLKCYKEKLAKMAQTNSEGGFPKLQKNQMNYHFQLCQN